MVRIYTSYFSVLMIDYRYLQKTETSQTYLYKIITSQLINYIDKLFKTDVFIRIVLKFDFFISLQQYISTTKIRQIRPYLKSKTMKLLFPIVMHKYVVDVFPVS